MANTTLFILNPEKYFEGILDILKKYSKGKNVIYVTTNKPYSHIVKILKKAGIKPEEIFFIDCISKHIGAMEQEPKNCIFIESPEGLTELSVAISESIKNLTGEKILLLDSLSTLLIYHDTKTIGQFSNFIINKMRASDVDSIILALESDVEKDIIKQIESFADEVKK